MSIPFYLLILQKKKPFGGKLTSGIKKKILVGIYRGVKKKTTWWEINRWGKKKTTWWEIFDGIKKKHIGGKLTMGKKNHIGGKLTMG